MTQQPDWKALAEPFPDEEVKQRPGAARYPHKPSCEGARCRQTQDPEAHIQFSYVDARAVAQRLDDVLTPARWEFTCAPAGSGDVVHGRLTIILDSLEKVTREDFGYPNSDRDEEPLKAAASDALKRCAVQFGVGRHLYEDNRPAKPAQTVQNAPQRPQAVPAAPVATPRPVSPVTPPSVEPDWMSDAMAFPKPAVVPTAREFEQQHGVAVAVDNPPLTLRKFFDAIDAKGIAKDYAATAARRMFGTSMLKDLTDAQRGDLWAEIAS